MKQAPEGGSKNCGKLQAGKPLTRSQPKTDPGTFSNTAGGKPGNIKPATF